MGVDPAATCVERLEQLIALALGFHGWTRAELSRRLGRNASNIVPDSGLPKLDYIVALADVLDWPIDHVVDWIVGDSKKSAPLEDDGRSFEELNRAAYELHCEGKYAEVLQLGTIMTEKASTPVERVQASIRIAIAHGGSGRYRQMLETTQLALRQPFDSHLYRVALWDNMALAYHSLDSLPEASAVSRYLIANYESVELDDPTERSYTAAAVARSRYVYGDCARRFAEIDTTRVREHAEEARVYLSQAIGEFEDLASKFQPDSCYGVANTCRGSLMEVEVLLGLRNAEDAVNQILETVNSLEKRGYPIHDKLESYGWWCVYGANIALRHIDDPKFQQRSMLSFTQAADQIATRLSNWVLRQRVYALEYKRRAIAAELLGVEPEWTIGRHELQSLLGSIGRFPGFEAMGRAILQRAVVVDRPSPGISQ